MTAIGSSSPSQAPPPVKHTKIELTDNISETIARSQALLMPFALVCIRNSNSSDLNRSAGLDYYLIECFSLVENDGVKSHIERINYTAQQYIPSHHVVPLKGLDEEQMGVVECATNLRDHAKFTTIDGLSAHILAQNESLKNSEEGLCANCNQVTEATLKLGCYISQLAIDNPQVQAVHERYAGIVLHCSVRRDETIFDPEFLKESNVNFNGPLLSRRVTPSASSLDSRTASSLLRPPSEGGAAGRSPLTKSPGPTSTDRVFPPLMECCVTPDKSKKTGIGVDLPHPTPRRAS